MWRGVEGCGGVYPPDGAHRTRSLDRTLFVQGVGVFPPLFALAKATLFLGVKTEPWNSS